MFWPFKKKSDKKSVISIDVARYNRISEYAISLAKRVTEETSDRLAGSYGCKKCASILFEEFKKYSDDALITSFQSSQKDYYITFKLIAISALCILLFCLLNLPVLGLIQFIFVLIYVFREFLLCKRNKHIFKTDMTNIHCEINPKGSVKQTIIFTSHHDAALLFSFDKNDKKSVRDYLTIPLLHFLVLGLISFIFTIKNIISLELFSLLDIWQYILVLLQLPFCYYYYKLYRSISNEVSPGVGDNLISSALLCALARYYHDKEIHELKNIQLVFASFDGEECGLKGSSAWFEAYKSHYVNPRVINLDSLYSLDELTILTKDVNGFVSLDKNLASEITAIATSMGYKVKSGGFSLFCGASDAASAVREGISAITIFAASLNGDGYYHTREDKLDKIDKKLLDAISSILIKYIQKQDNSLDNDILELDSKLTTTHSN